MMNLNVIHCGRTLHNGQIVYVMVARKMGEQDPCQICGIVDFDPQTESLDDGYQKARAEVVRQFKMLDESRANSTRA